MKNKGRNIKLNKWEYEALIRLLDDSNEFVKRDDLPHLIAKNLRDLFHSISGIVK